jgi:TonB family protein
MWPLSMLFSSDEHVSQAMGQALRELEFEVVCCPEIFSAVEKITSRSYDVIVSDWNEGLEAAFLLKTSRELQSNHAAFTVAIASPEAASAARQAGADLVLSRPIVPDEVKYALLTCDPFLLHMKTWLPKLGFAPAEGTLPKNPKPNPLPRSENSAAESPRPLRAWPSPLPHHSPERETAVVPAEAIFEDDLLYRSRVQTLFQPPEPSFSVATSIRRKSVGRLLPGMAIVVAFLSVGYVFSEPLRGESGSTSVSQICGRVLERTEAWLHRPEVKDAPALAVQTAENDNPENTRPGHAIARIRVVPVRDPFQAANATPENRRQQPLQVEAQASSPQEPTATTAVPIPDSLKTPVQAATMRSVAARITPSLLAALEPVALSEDLSRGLLLQKVLPSYPEQAIRARLQGPVVLQAWIGRDGTIQDLKLIRGSFLLGQAAYQAVKQWRYQPYLVNGRAVEAQTFVTVDFKLP